jgi:hypothetical protein
VCVCVCVCVFVFVCCVCVFGCSPTFACIHISSAEVVGTSFVKVRLTLSANTEGDLKLDCVLLQSESGKILYEISVGDAISAAQIVQLPVDQTDSSELFLVKESAIRSMEEAPLLVWWVMLRARLFFLLAAGSVLCMLPFAVRQHRVWVV